MAGESERRGAVVITGTSTGIGAATAVRLVESGFHVFAGVRRAEDGEALRSRAPDGLTPIRIDITEPATIAAAADTVAGAVGERGLAGLVNNAGIVKPAPIEFQPLDDFREQLEVNLVAHVAVTQAFLPLIRLGGGRIVNVGSIGGRLVLPIHGAYSASKFGMEALSDALRLELRQWRIHVSLVDPGATETAIFGKTLAELDALQHRLGEVGYRLYAEQIAAVRRLVEKTAAEADPPAAVAKAVADALVSDEPETRYLAGHGAKAAAALARLADGMKDLAVAKEVGLPDPE
jgi:NAD(P)-dependent dehydrogenase (short-subunit alcohol dehydrogenase family)